MAGVEREAKRSEHRFTTSYGAPLPPVFDTLPEGFRSEAPGVFPFTRGIHPEMYRTRHWTMRQYAGFGSARETNARYRYLLASGTTGLSVAFDLPTQIGLDSDDPLSCGEVGRVGVAIDSLSDMETLFEGIDPAAISVSMTINAPAMVLLAFYVVMAERRGVPAAALTGTIQNDILKEYAARGTYIYPPAPALRLVTDCFEYGHANLPKFNMISISGYHMREAGCDSVQEVAFTLGNGIAYVEAAVRRGLDVDGFGRRLSFFFNAHNGFLEEIAKFRAARRLWADIMKNRFGSHDPRAQMLRFHTQTGGSTLTSQQPEVNIVRVALQALAAVLGGTQSLHTNGFDEALCLPTESSARLALRTQQVIADEGGVVGTADPLGGSCAIESLTSDIERRARDLIAEIDAYGGSLGALDEGFIQRRIADSAYRYQKSVESGETPVLGVNRHVAAEPERADVRSLDPAVERDQVAALRARKAGRDPERVGALLRTLEAAARTSENLFPIVIECARAEATVGEISNTLRRVFGLYEEKVRL